MGEFREADMAIMLGTMNGESLVSMKMENTTLAFPLDLLVKFFFMEYETLEKYVVKHLYEPGDVVLEIGAGSGAVTVEILKTGADVYAVEPIKKYFDILRHVVLLNGFDAHFANVAVGPREGRAKFYIPNMEYGASLLQTDDMDALHEVEVDVVSISDILQVTKANAVHIDAEGAEVILLQAMDLSLVNKVSMEVHPRLIGTESYDEIIHPMLEDAGLHFVVEAGMSANYPTHNYAVGYRRES